MQSKGPKKIEDILKSAKLDYKKEYSFDDLRSSKGRRLRFDFAVFRYSRLFCLIEFDGEQHYNINNPRFTYDGVNRDMQKNYYCYTHAIPLIRIKQKDIDNINSFRDLFKYLI